MGRYDLPAAFNHVLTVTGRSKLVYIGFSMGKTPFGESIFLYHILKEISLKNKLFCILQVRLLSSYA